MARHVKNQSPYSPRPVQPARSGRSHAARSAHARADREFRTYDTSQIMPKRKSKAPVVFGLVLALIVVAAAAFLLVPRLTGAVAQAELLPEGETAIVVVKDGEGAKSIGGTLAEAKLVSSAGDFVKRVEALDAEYSLIPGTYEFSGGMTVDEIVEALKVGPAATADTLTVPEGLTREATAAKVEDATGGRIGAQQFLDATADASAWASEFSFLQSAGSNSLEGFLFPKTYTVTAADDARSVVRMMLRQFQAETSDLSFDYPSSQGLSLYDAVKLASIVEKEAAAENRATVASVFYNRLASDRPYLESDATTAYEVGHDPTAEEVHANTPYSTYANEGLPPTPICSSSLSCLQAVCNPEVTDYLFFYFVPNGEGGMDYYFSKTYDEHQAAIAAS